MRTGITLLWLIFAALFFFLGVAHWAEAGKTIPPFKITQRELQKPGSGVEVHIAIAGTPLDQPLQDFARDFNSYLAGQNESSRSINRRAAWGYFLAAFTAVASAVLEWREHLAGFIARGRVV